MKALLYYKFINVLQKGSWLAKCKTQNANVAKSQMCKICQMANSPLWRNCMQSEEEEQINLQVALTDADKKF